ncbi:MAG: alpha/beta hydrolase [Sphaerobacter sp.]|nr:alpha/beta hydrolase [Sphaerobacter sp.]MDI3341399.1 alpha/beta hydrolase [Sphaerobacter sp.]
MRSYTVQGGGGVRLHVEETGNPSGRPILFIHGFSQCRLAWDQQMRSDLADDFRLVAMDIRGHGLSDRPRDGYDDPRRWADDVQAVIETLGLDRPVLSGWSYGGLIILDYVRYYGEERLGGIHLVGAISKIGTPEATAPHTGRPRRTAPRRPFVSAAPSSGRGGPCAGRSLLRFPIGRRRAGTSPAPTG